MPFTDEEEFYGPLAIPQGMDVTPEPKQYNASVLGAASRRENEIVSAATSFQFDPQKPFNPDFRPWEEIQGTDYERYASRFVGAQDREDVTRMKAQIDREIEDRSVLDAAGWGGFAAQMAASLLSPTTLLPGGAIVKGAKGVSIARTALKIGTSAALATSIQEAFLQGTQQTRSTSETAFAIGGSFILGGVLGAASGKLASAEFKAAGRRVEEIMSATKEYDDALRSIGAAENEIPAADLELRREKIFATVDKIPVLRAIVRSDPILRAQLSPNVEARRALVDLVETPLQYKVNEEGRGVRNGELSVEAAIRDRQRTELASTIQYLQRSFAEYSKDGPVGIVGTFTAPITRRFENLLGKDRKLTSGEFMEEVGKALRDGDKHPIPQVQSAADAIRRTIFDKIKDDAIEVGIFDPDLQVKNADSYFTRVYNTEKIAQHFGDGTENDLLPVLTREFSNRRAEAQRILAEDDTLNRREIDLLQQREIVKETRSAIDRAREKAVQKRERAGAAIKREAAVQRVSQRLRAAFKSRQSQIEQGIPDKDATRALKEMIADARALKRLEPKDILAAIRSHGGIREDGSGEMRAALDTKYLTIHRKFGLEPDYAREMLEELGYLPQGSTVNDMWSVIRDAANGKKVYSYVEDAADIARYEAAQEFAAEMDRLGIDLSRPFDEITAALYGNLAVKTAKAGEAGRAAKRVEGVSDAALSRVEKAMDKLEEAKARIAELDKEIGPKLRQEIKDAIKESQKLVSEIRDLKKKKAVEEFYASKDDAEIRAAAEDAIASLIRMRPGEHSFGVSMAHPTRARVLDVPDKVLEPWLESDAEMVLAQYFHSMVPDIELARKFNGDVEGKGVIERIWAEGRRQMKDAGSAKERAQIKVETEERVKDFEGMRDRLRGRYGAPRDPRNGWIVGGRVARTLSYTGYLGGMMLSAIPDIAGVIGRGGIEDSFGASATALTDPKRLFASLKEAAEWGAGAEWWLNSRAISMSEVFDPYGKGSTLERAMGEGARAFSIMTGMIPWNVGWKSVGGAVISTRMAKAVEAMANGKATKKQKLLLGANNIEPWMADRIAKQIEAHADKGDIWLLHGADWTDEDAFKAFRAAMNREFDLMVITPGQDKPLAFSTEAGKFFGQFKSFSVSAHHRILLAGIQKADADVLAQFTSAVLLGGLVSNIKAWQGGYDQKEGSAFWQDAIDRSGLAGWLMEPYNAASGATGGFYGLTEPVSRFQARSYGQGLLGPSVDMASGIYEGLNAMASGTHSYRDVRKLMRPIPGNNITYLLPLFKQIEDALVYMTGAKPRPE